MHRLLATTALIAIALTSVAQAADIHIAAAGPMTGENAAFGQQLKEGASKAVADINKAGGVLGQKLVLDIGDDACDPKQAVSAANDLASKGVKFVAGHYCSGSSIPASKVYTEENIVEISPASTNPKYTDEGSWNTFRVCGRDDQQGRIAGQYLASHFKADKIAVLNDNSAYGKGLADETQKSMNAAGKVETFATSYTAGEHDYSALVSRMKQAGITVAYVGGYHKDTALIARQSKDQGLKLTLVGGDALVTNEFWQIAGDAGQGTLMTFGADPLKRVAAKKVIDELKADKVDPEGYVLYTYAAVQVWAEAAKKAGTVDPKKVAAEMKSSGPWNTVLGPISFDKKGDPTKSDFVFYIWKNGNYAEM